MSRIESREKAKRILRHASAQSRNYEEYFMQIKSVAQALDRYKRAQARSAAMSDPEELPANPEASGSGSAAPAGGRDGGMSKSAQKKASRQARREILKPQRRMIEKSRRKERAAALSEGYAKDTLSQTDRALVEQRRGMIRERKRAKAAVKEGGTERDWMGGVVVDLGFDALMTDQEITSTTSQLSYVYSYNRTAPRPFATVLHTSFSPTASPRLWEKMTKSNWERWTRSYWWAEGLEGLSRAMTLASNASFPVQSAVSDVSICDPKTDDLESHLTGPHLPPNIHTGQRLVYLSADSAEELTTLSEDEIYIIGGIVDRNRHKMLCQEKAEKLGIRTARLPIGRYLENLTTRKVLTVNQVFAILLRYMTLQSWSAAFEAVIPQRKYQRVTQSVQGKEGGEKEGEEAHFNDENDAEAATPRVVKDDEDKGHLDMMNGNEVDEEAVLNAG